MRKDASSRTVVRAAAKRAPLNIVERRERRKFDAYTVSRLMEEYRDPRAILLEMAGWSIVRMMKTLGCTPMDAVAEKRLCAQAVLPYVAQKLPVQVDMRHTRAIHLNIVDDRQYAELVDIAAEPTADSDDNISLQLTANVTDVDTSPDDDSGSETPVMPSAPQQPPRGGDDSMHTDGASERTQRNHKP